MSNNEEEQTMGIVCGSGVFLASSGHSFSNFDLSGYTELTMGSGYYFASNLSGMFLSPEEAAARPPWNVSGREVEPQEESEPLRDIVEVKIKPVVRPMRTRLDKLKEQRERRRKRDGTKKEA